MRGSRYIITVFVLMLVTSANAFGQTRVVAQVDTSKEIYIGQSFIYIIIIDGDNKPGKVDLTPLAEYNPQSADSRDVSQTSISIINNRTTRNVVKRYLMTYSLTTSDPGPVTLPPVTVNIDGKDYRTNPVQVNVLKPGTTDKLDFEVALSEQKCYVGQPVIMTVRFYAAVSADVGEFQFNVPALSNDSLYVEEPDVSDPQARLYRLNTGMTVSVSQRQVTHKGQDFILLSFSKALIPKRAGRIDLGIASASAAIAVGRVRSRNSIFDDFGFFGSRKEYRQFAVKSEPLNLTVLPVPEEGKPSEFYGLVGRYEISVSATPTKVNVGDPITLTIRIGGGRYLKPVQWPALEQVGELAANFKIPSQKASPTIENGFKIFTQTIRAMNDKVSEIPAIGLAYFDAEKGEYAVAKTAPIELEVAPTRTLTNADLEGADVTGANKEVEAIKKGLSANYEGLDALRNVSFSPLAALVSPGYAVVWAAPLIGLLSSLLIKLAAHSSPEKAAAKRRRQAGGSAIRQLKKAASADARQRNELLVSIMRQYIGDRFDKTAGSLTPDDCRDAIIDAAGDPQDADRYGKTMAGFEAARYTSVQTGTNTDKTNEVIALVRNIEKKCKRYRTKSSR
jgi:hypothetical protein